MSIYIVWGHPGEGKSYNVTREAVKALLDGKSVFSNYPIITGKNNEIRSFIWKPEYAALQNPPTNAVICIDEAYRDYNSREFKNFSKEVHTYFATNRHNGLEIYIIAQNPARIDVALREISQFILCKKVGFLRWILGFRLEYYEFIEDLSARKMGNREAFYRKEFHRFSKKVANAYDTAFYRIMNPEPFEGERWILPGENQSNQDDQVDQVTTQEIEYDLFEPKLKKYGFWEGCIIYYRIHIFRFMRKILTHVPLIDEKTANKFFPKWSN